MIISRNGISKLRWVAIACAMGSALLVAAVAGAVDHKAGDLNGDGCVDFTDFAAFQANFNGIPTGPCPAAADIDQDGGPIDFDDFDLFANYILAPVACRPTTSPHGCPTYNSCDVVCESVCNLPDNGSGTVELPPEDCSYLSPGGFHAIIDSLPPGTRLEVNVAHSNFTNITRTPGGTLGGEIEEFDSDIRLEIHGRGTLIDYQRVIVLPGVPVEIHTGPKQPGEASQVFDTDMRSLEAEITGDMDFDLLRITAGTDNGLPSPGSTALAQTNSFDTFSFFSVKYRIEMVGAAGSQLEGVVSTTTGTVRMGTPGTTQGVVPALAPAAFKVLIVLFIAMALGVGALRARMA